MKALKIQIAHGWRTERQGGELIRVDYYAIGSPELSNLVVSVPLGADGSQRVNANEEHAHLAQLQADTIADYAAIWAAQYAYPEQTDDSGGGEILSDEAVIILASYHPDWFMGRDLCHILSVIDEDDAETLSDDLFAAREDLRVFVEALSSPLSEWEEEVAYAA